MARSALTEQNPDEVFKLKLEGSLYTFPKIIQGRFYIDKRIDGGAFGAIFDCLDRVNKVKCVIKIVSLRPLLSILQMTAKACDEFEREVLVLMRLKEQSSEILITSGQVKPKLYYIILKKFGPNLKTVLEKMKHNRFTIKTAV